jgi:hypothetical protein
MLKSLLRSEYPDKTSTNCVREGGVFEPVTLFISAAGEILT